MSASPSSSSDTAFVLVAVLVLLVLRRVYRSYHGIRFSAWSTVGVLVLYVLIGALFSATSFFEGVSVLFLAPYLLVVVLAGLWSYRFTDKRISFWQGGDGQVYFKGGMLLYFVYIVALVARLSIDFFVIGPSFLSFSPTVALTGSSLDATIATDILLMFGLGLLIGRNARVLKRYRGIEEGKETLPETPPPVEPLFRRKDASS